MVKVVMNIEGMACSMCEGRVNSIVSGVCKAEKLVSSHKKGTCEFVCEEAPDEGALRAAIEDFGYAVKGYSCEKQEKKGFFLFKK